MNPTLIILVLVYIYCFYIATHENIPVCIKKIQEACLYGCNDESCKSNVLPKGTSYIINDEEASRKSESCIISSWNVSHFILYTLLSYLNPTMWRELIGMGVAFEVYEHYAYNCEDVMDIFANTAGVILGSYIKSISVAGA